MVVKNMQLRTLSMTSQISFNDEVEVVDEVQIIGSGI